MTDMTPNILMTRIDNRLVHGQVGVTWVNTLSANLLIVANDIVANDPVQQHLMKMVLPETIGIRCFSIKKVAAIISKASPKQRIFIVVKTPQDVLRLLDLGVPINKLNVGNMHFSEGKKQISTNVNVNEDDIQIFMTIKEKYNIPVFIQGIPGQKQENIYDLI